EVALASHRGRGAVPAGGPPLAAAATELLALVTAPPLARHVASCWRGLLGRVRRGRRLDSGGTGWPGRRFLRISSSAARTSFSTRRRRCSGITGSTSPSIASTGSQPSIGLWSYDLFEMVL